MIRSPENILTHLQRKQGSFGKNLGIEITKADENSLVAELFVKSEFVNRNGVMHGGVLMAFADEIGGTATYINLPTGLNTTTIESKTNFLRPIKIGERIRGEVFIISYGKKLVVLQSDIFRSDNKLAAKIIQTQMLLKFDHK